MKRGKWIRFFCFKYLLKYFLLWGSITAFLLLFFFIISLAFKKTFDSTAWLFLWVGIFAFLVSAIRVIPFITKIKDEEKFSNCEFNPNNPEKIVDVLYFDNEWIIICGKTVINIASLTKIITMSSSSRGVNFFDVSFYVINNDKPISFSIGLGFKPQQEFEKLASRVEKYAEKINCPYERSRMF